MGIKKHLQKIIWNFRKWVLVPDSPDLKRINAEAAAYRSSLISTLEEYRNKKMSVIAKVCNKRNRDACEV